MIKEIKRLRFQRKHKGFLNVIKVVNKGVKSTERFGRRFGEEIKKVNINSKPVKVIKVKKKKQKNTQNSFFNCNLLKPSNDW